MLDALKFVQGAVAKKDFSPILTHFRIQDELIRGYNGKIGLCSPIGLGVEASPDAISFIKAIKACKDTTSMHLTSNNRLAIKSGKFKAFIKCTEEIYPDVSPQGDMIELNDTFLSALKKIAAFISEDASREWSRGILFRGQSAFATNNILLIEYWLGYDFPIEINIPAMAVKELLRIKTPPTHMQVTKSSVTFHYEENRWLKTQLNNTEWPNLAAILEGASNQESPLKGFFEAVEDIAPLVDEIGRIFLLKDKLSTSQHPEEGASVDMPGLPEGACFHFNQLLTIKGLIKTIDFSSYPKPCLFYGDNIRGAIVGVII